MNPTTGGRHGHATCRVVMLCSTELYLGVRPSLQVTSNLGDNPLIGLHTGGVKPAFSGLIRVARRQTSHVTRQGNDNPTAAPPKLSEQN